LDTGARTDSPGLVVARGILRYSGHALREQLTRRRATRLTDVPVRTREVTREWLTAVLCGEHVGAAVESHGLEDVSNGTSSRWRATVTYNDAGRNAGLPTALFAKTSRSWTQRLLLGMADVLTVIRSCGRRRRPSSAILPSSPGWRSAAWSAFSAPRP
jgi:hypothetical protein